jgi:hypothetical protein
VTWEIWDESVAVKDRKVMVIDVWYTGINPAREKENKKSLTTTRNPKNAFFSFLVTFFKNHEFFQKLAFIRKRG